MGIWINKRKGKHTYMKDLNLHEEIIKSLKLISYDRSKTIMEQVGLFPDEEQKYEWNKSKNVSSKVIEPEEVKPTWSDEYKDAEKRRKKREKEQKIQKYVEKKIKQSCDTSLRKNYSFSSYRVAKEIMLVIKNNIETKGTEEDDVLNAIKRIKSVEIYDALQFFILKCYPGFNTVMQLLQLNEFSTGGVKIKPKYGGTIHNISQLSKGEIGIDKMWSAGDEIQWLNDYYLVEMEKVLKKWNANEKFEREIPKDTFQKIFPPFTREVFHSLLPLASIILLMVPGAQTVSGALLSMLPDVLDAAIYAFADKDPYMAGLTITFAFLAPLQSVAIQQKILKYSKSVLSKLGKNAAWELTDEEVRFLAEFRRQEKYYLKLARQEMLKKYIKNIFTKIFRIKNPKLIVDFINWLIKKGVVATKFLSTTIFTIGGVSFTWDMIAPMFGLGCKKTFSWGEMVGSFGYKTVGQGLEWVQPFTKTKDQCKEQHAKILLSELKKEAEKMKNNLNEFTATILNQLIKNNIIFSKSDYYNFDMRVIFIQLFLNSFLQKVNIQNYSETPKWEKKTKEGYVNFNYDPKYDYLYRPENKEKLDKLRVSFSKAPKKNKKITFQWGRFGDNTSNAIKQYQKQNRLEVDGVANLETLKMMLSDCKIGKYGQIKNVTGLNLLNSKEIETDMKQKAYEEYKKKVSSANKVVVEEKETVEKALERSPVLKEKMDKYVDVQNVSDTVSLVKDLNDWYEKKRSEIEKN